MTDVLDRETDAETALLVVPEFKDALSIFTKPDATGADNLLNVVRSKVDAFLKERPDVSTEAGRAAIRSFAHKVVKSKTALEEVGKALAAEQKEIPKRIDATRRRIKDLLDSWRDEVRQPLTDWEKAEEDRVSRIKADLAEFQAVIDDRQERSSECLRDRLGEIQATPVTEVSFGEYTGAAVELKAEAIRVLEDQIARAEKREADAAELAKLRAEAEARAKKDREEQIAREAAEKAKADAESKAQAERDAAARREAELKAEAERAERARIEAEERADRAAQEAREKAEREAHEKVEREAAEKAAREADREHRAKINRAAHAALVDGGLSSEAAKLAIKLIASGAVPSISIYY
jgi:septal ring factor EnvC (AmiA/AmiB activator)